jgi:hypothetical protein
MAKHSENLGSCGPLGAIVGAGPGPDKKQPHSPGNSWPTVLNACSRQKETGSGSGSAPKTGIGYTPPAC